MVVSQFHTHTLLVAFKLFRGIAGLSPGVQLNLTSANNQKTSEREYITAVS